MKIIISVTLMLFSMLTKMKAVRLPTKGACIQIHFNDAKDGDSIKVQEWIYNLITDETRKTNWYRVKNGRISFQFSQIDQPHYYTVSDSKRRKIFLERYIVEAGDSISISYNDSVITFSGRGSLKSSCWYAIQTLKSKIWKNRRSYSGTETKQIEYDYCDKSTNASLVLLENYKSKISTRDYNLLKADIIAIDLLYSINITGFEAYVSADSSKKLALMALYTRFNKTDAYYAPMIDPNAAGISFYWADYLLKKYTIENYWIPQKKKFDLPIAFTQLADRYKGLLRDHILTRLLFVFQAERDSLVPYLNKAAKIIKDTLLASIIQKERIHFLPGSMAYNFILSDTNGNKVRLSDFKGKVVLMDLWFTGCVNCVLVNNAMKPIEEKLKKYPEFVFVSISTDREKSLWLKGLKSGEYTSYERINLFTNQLGIEDPFIKYYDIQGYPTLLLVDKKGKLVSARLPDPRVYPDKLTAELIGALEK